MKRFLTALLLATVTMFAPAGSLSLDAVSQAGFADLTETQKAELIKQIAATKSQTEAEAAQAKAAAKSAPQKVNEWLDIGQRIGGGMASAAREMGVAVNEFAASPVGMWTIALITWKVVGSAAAHVLGGMLTLIVGFSFLLYLNRKKGGYKAVYDPEKTDIIGRSRLVSVEREAMTDEAYGGNLVCGAIILLFATAVTFTW